MALASVQTVNGNRKMIANTSIKKGDLIVQENPFLVCNTTMSTSAWNKNTNTFYADERSGRSRILSTAISALSAEERSTFESLYAPGAASTPLDTLIHRFEKNSYEIESRRKKTHLVLYPTLCFINHSCVPNATMKTWASKTTHPEGQARLIATRAIPAGAEVTFNYSLDLSFDDLTARKPILQDGWDFTCTCEGCAPPAQAAMDAAERRSLAAYQTFMDIPAPAAGTPQANQYADRMHTYIRLLGSLGIWDEALSHA